MNNQRIIQVEEKVPLKMLVPLSIQHMFAMFGASVLVPFLFGINPAIVLFMNGVGTLLFIVITKGKSPAYLGSSFAFLAPAGIVIATWGYSYALGGFVAVGICGCILAGIIYKFGTDWIDIVLPPAAMGPVVALIGLELAGTAAKTAGVIGSTSYVLDKASGLYNQVITTISPNNAIVFLVTLGFAVFGSVLFKKFLSVIPILIAIIAGYIAALITGVVGSTTFQAVADAPWFALPNFQFPQFKLEAILMILPVLLVISSEHIGHQIVTGKVVGRDLIKDPGLHRSLLADYISTTLSGLVGSVPTTTYGENIGVMAVTKVYSVQVIAGAAILSIICGFVGKLSMLISTIPGPVIGGISFLLYGMIGASGIRILVEAQVDYGKSRNLTLTSVIFVVGLSGVAVNFGSIQLTGMVLSAVVGMLLSLTFYILDKLKLTNDREEEHLYDQP
ncbi:uracil permease [Acetobacterium tundrae]|uniref:Uracil permease n=1 Tax=Acetobacterium tundrae TaxID=132932 RepID=A0ABR6WNL2_9FIRM|nr:uracil permease [Acetobacterium tundrae]MBC3797906.1 uracil permease [Acetobacterium tundrae]